jgi:hypothetical protein
LTLLALIPPFNAENLSGIALPLHSCLVSFTLPESRPVWLGDELETTDYSPKVIFEAGKQHSFRGKKVEIEVLEPMAIGSAVNSSHGRLP